MLDSELKFYLKTHLEPPSINFVWRDEDNKKLFEYLNENCEEECLLDKENQLKIKQAFKDYFEPVGYILFKMSGTQIRLKVFAYKIEPKDSINLPAVLDILESNEKIIEYDYNGKDNQISIPKEIKDKIYNFINNITDEEVSRKELARYAVTEFFELQEHDIVIVKDKQIFIKILDYPYKRKVKESEKNTIANRYNGINEDELKSLYGEFFAQNENKHFFYYVAKLFVQVYFLDQKIDNFTYENKRYTLIQSIISEQLNHSYNNDDDFCTGFAGYIFRIHFQEVFEHISNFILAEIAISNDYMINFVKYYSSDVIVLEGKRYKVPRLETESGLRWNAASILSIVKIYVKIKTTIDSMKKEINELNKKLQELYIEGHPPSEYKRILVDKKDKLEEDIIKDKKKVEKCYDVLDLSNDKSEKSKLQSEIRTIRDGIELKRQERKTITGNMVKSSIINEYNKIKNDIDGIKRQMKRDQRILQQNEESYMSIRHALAKALASKRVLIG